MESIGVPRSATAKLPRKRLQNQWQKKHQHRKSVQKKAEKPALPEKEVLKPLKNKAVIKKAARFQEEDAVQYYSDPSSVPQYTDPFQPPYAQETVWSQLLLQRQAQARMRAQSVASPYAAMFASQRSRVM